jgi:hypothetical protein
MGAANRLRAMKSCSRRGLVTVVGGEYRTHATSGRVYVNLTIGDHVESPKIVPGLTRSFQCLNVLIDIDPAMVLRSLSTRFELQLDGTTGFSREGTTDIDVFAALIGAE